MKVFLPVEYCVGCGTQLMPTTWWFDEANVAEICVSCVKRRAGAGEAPACRKRTDREIADMASRIRAGRV